MKISVPLQNGVLPDQYAKYATGSDVHNGQPVRSFPIRIEDAPEGTQSFALSLLDFDAIPVSGFPWIHWVAANFPGDITEIPEDDSRTLVVPHTLGKNSNAGSLINETNPSIIEHYTGPFPPDADHTYTLTVYALKSVLDLEEGFWLNELMHDADSQTLTTATCTFIGRV
ncbi:YbhB/YbcL family Raf kinase inhibitor-like protein [Levilactobacillus bambusae]|uniref:YbhB/YbcL family Raf kinase inhibitor-like protein n=1 Tax=Levilactobacillus bambusae TaxID=2024736 RepID=A0A2V1MXP4_9LACO|nr:YbhB/YbcL family Raf kinase inhibitor-like protein [Levilactobacillus bambusae]PWF99820.1 YbhB/YbcL family Raf kinase inhibitor-like protein [Levilactobacillus bambusae]